MFYLFQLFFLFLLVVSSASLVKNKIVKFIVLVLFVFFIAVELISLSMMGSFTNYQAIVHMSLNELRWISLIANELIIGFVAIIIMFVCFQFIDKKIARFKVNYKYKLLLIAFLLVGLSYSERSVFNELYQAYQLKTVEEVDFVKALENIGISPQNYIEKNKLTARAGKNIIVVSIESLESLFLEPPYNRLTPFINKLRRSEGWTYKELEIEPGSKWTSGSLYKHQVGLPAFFKGDSGSVFHGVTDVRLPGLGSIFEKAGYQYTYIIGNSNFGGVLEFLQAYDYDVITHNNSLGTYKQHGGKLFINDYDVFNEAKLQLTSFQKNNPEKPFALFITTMNTHTPGIIDPRMEKFIGKHENGLDSAVASIDYILKDFFTYLENNNLLDNTMIYIFPDHLYMGQISTDRKRMGFFLTNVKNLDIENKQKVFQLDMPRFIVKGAEIETNVKFLTDFLEDNEKVEFQNKYALQLTALNEASIFNKGYAGDINIFVDNDKLYIKSDSKEIKVNLLNKNSPQLYRIRLNSKNMTRVQSFTDKYKTEAFSLKRFVKFMTLSSRAISKKRLALTLLINKGKIWAYFGNTQEVGKLKSGQKLSFNEEEIDLIISNSNYNRWFNRWIIKLKTSNEPNIEEIKQSMLSEAGLH